MKHTRKFLRSKRHLAWCMYLRAMRTSFMLPYWIVPRDFVYFGISWLSDAAHRTGYPSGQA